MDIRICLQSTGCDRAPISHTVQMQPSPTEREIEPTHTHTHTLNSDITTQLENSRHGEETTGPPMTVGKTGALTE